MGRSRYKSNEITKKKFNCAAYIRLSQEDGDKEESNSVTSQREIIDYYLKNENEIELYDYYIDDGFTGTDFKRPSFQRMLDDIQKGSINTIIVKDLSRFGRNYIEVGNFIEQVFPQYKIRFISISDKIDNFKNPESLNSMIFPFKNMINEEYCRDISRKIRSVKLIGAKKGNFMQGLAPYGYIKNPEDKHKFIIDDEAAKIIKLIYKKFIDGEGYGAIVRYLNDNDIYCPSRYKKEVQNLKYGNPSCTEETISNKKWTIQSVKSILENQVYCGDLIQGKQKCLSHKNHKSIRTDKEEWIIVENTHDAIITREEFKKVQKILEDKQYTGEIKSQPNLYAGHLKCGKCKKFMIRSENLDKIVLKAIKHQIKLYLKADKLIDEIINQRTDNDTKATIERIEKEMTEKRKIKQKFYEDWKLGIITKEEYMQYVNGAEKTINILNDRYKKYSEKLEEEEKLNDNKEIFKNIKEYENIKTLNKKLIDDLIDNIYSNEDGSIEIEFKYQDEYKKLLKLAKKIKKNT